MSVIQYNHLAQLNAGRMRISLQCDCAVVATISHLQSCMYAYT